MIQFDVRLFATSIHNIYSRHRRPYKNAAEYTGIMAEGKIRPSLGMDNRHIDIEHWLPIHNFEIDKLKSDLEIVC